MSISTFPGYDPKVHGKMNVVFSDVRKCTFDDTLNIRFHKGATLLGVYINVDTRDVPGMSYQLKEHGGIHTPMVISERADGTWVILIGNRRGAGAFNLLANDPDAREGTELFKALTTRTPMIILRNLTPQQERNLINDQKGVKSYLRSELFRDVCALMQNGDDFFTIAFSRYEQYAQAFGAHKQLQEYIAIPGELHAERKKKLSSWLGGNLRSYWMNAYYCGPRIIKATLISEMAYDGLRHPEDELPEYFTTKNAQVRMKAMLAAKEADDKIGQWTPEGGGPTFNALIKKYHDEDFDEDGKVRAKTATAKKGMTDADIKKALAENKIKSPPMRALLQSVTGDFEGDITVMDDDLMFHQMAKNEVFSSLTSLKEGLVKDTLKCVFLSNNILDLKNLIAAHSNELTSGNGAQYTVPEVA